MKHISTVSTLIILSKLMTAAPGHASEVAASAPQTPDRRWLLSASVPLPGLRGTWTFVGGDSLAAVSGPSSDLMVEYLLTPRVSVGLGAGLSWYGATASVSSSTVIATVSPHLTFRFWNRTFDGAFVTFRVIGSISTWSSPGFETTQSGVGLGIRGGYSYPLGERVFVSAALGADTHLAFFRRTFPEAIATAGQAVEVSVAGVFSVGLTL